jgi:hypothetical protein
MQTFDVTLVINIVLSLIAVFQLWLARYEKKMLRNSLVAIREMLEKNTAPDAMLSALDGVLANLGGRNPFVQQAKNIVTNVVKRFGKIQNRPVGTPSPFSEEVREAEPV